MPQNFIFENTTIEGTKKTPRIVLDKSGLIEISGRSLPENCREFYEHLTSWLEEYVKNPVEKTEINCKFDYLNSSSTVLIFRLISQVEEDLESGKYLTINWYFEDDDPEMEELGNHFKDLIKSPLNLISVEAL